ncbi:phosphatidylinositol 4-phosphate 5-kinase type-1 beta-like isoform X3 [Schistocerca gregaria]|nr:phosphatidylinositol 4-phosphate 5-kinase type-1 beta-like isoform X3 [Schistocerca gregaria]
MFYQTPDKAFFFKTILHAELKIMMGLLNDYVYHQTYQVVLLLDPKHLKTVSGNSFIMRVVGLHRLTHKNLRVWVLVFANSMPYGIVLDDELDLKGRIPKKGKSLKERGRFTPKSVAKKDNELDRGILFLRDKDRKIYTNRLIRDVNFLQSHNLMDYSLLVGIHYVKEEVQQQQSGASKDNKARPQNKERTDTKSGVSYKKETKTYDIQGGRKSAVDEYVYSVDRMLELGGFMGINPKNSKREIYFFGIIDCLTSFSIKKKTAYLFKSILWDKSTLSTVNATYYGHRFITFMTKNLITDKELNYHIDISNRPQSVVLEDEDNTLDELKSTVDSGIISTLEKSRSTLDEQPSLSTYLDKHFSHTRMAASTSA